MRKLRRSDQWRKRRSGNTFEGSKMNSCDRLNSVATDLVDLGKTLTATQRKLMACRVAEWACRSAEVVAYLSGDRLRFLSDPSYQTTRAERQAITNEVSDLDEKYFEIVEQHDGLDDAGEAMSWFRKARAVAAVSYALDASSVGTFCEALYEAHAATDDLATLRKLCSAGE